MFPPPVGGTVGSDLQQKCASPSLDRLALWSKVLLAPPQHRLLPMHIDKALSQISEIHAQVLKAEVFRGYRARTMLSTGVLALVGGLVQSVWLPPATASQFTLFWVGVAVVCAMICGADLCWRSLRIPGLRTRTIHVVSQSLPAVLAGAVVTGVLVQVDGSQPLLPGIWSILYALGIWSARPYLPRAVGMVALFYLLAGTWLLTQSALVVPQPWGMGLTFGTGQFALALVLYLNIERPFDAQVAQLGREVHGG